MAIKKVCLLTPCLHSTTDRFSVLSAAIVRCDARGSCLNATLNPIGCIPIEMQQEIWKTGWEAGLQHAMQGSGEAEVVGHEFFSNMDSHSLALKPNRCTVPDTHSHISPNAVSPFPHRGTEVGARFADSVLAIKNILPVSAKCEVSYLVAEKMDGIIEDVCTPPFFSIPPPPPPP